jgi:hypothetical protein
MLAYDDVYAEILREENTVSWLKSSSTEPACRGRKKI